MLYCVYVSMKYMLPVINLIFKFFLHQKKLEPENFFLLRWVSLCCSGQTQAILPLQSSQHWDCKKDFLLPEHVWRMAKSRIKDLASLPPLCIHLLCHLGFQYKVWYDKYLAMSSSCPQLTATSLPGTRPCPPNPEIMVDRPDQNHLLWQLYNPSSYADPSPLPLFPFL